MPYGDYLRDRSSQCIRLAVEQPWSDETGALIDLARNYSNLACGFERKQNGEAVREACERGISRIFDVRPS